MQQQYDVTLPQQNNQLPFFNPNDIFSILSSQLGLRLTSNGDEINHGGYGDAVPLSHLAGAKDCILFVTLSSILLRTPNLEPRLEQEYRNTLNTLFQSYAGKDAKLFDRTAPILMLVYASLIKLSEFTLEPKLLERRLPEKEELFLLDIYQKTLDALLPIFVFDRESAYYGDLPSLRLHLASDFNQLLAKRLQTNLGYYNARTMHYLLLQNPHQRFTNGYDWNHYPLGKVGSLNFSAQDIVSHITVHDTSFEIIWNWLKEECKLAPKPITTIATETPAPKPLSYFQQGVKFWQENKALVAGGVVGFGLFAGYKLLEYRQAITSDESHQPPQAGL